MNRRLQVYRTLTPTPLPRGEGLKGAFALLLALLLCACTCASASTVFPLQPSANGRYLVDQNGVPFRVQGEASWDAHINLNLTDLRAYLDDRQAKGFNALFTYVANPVAYYAGDSAPWVLQLGGSAAGVAALPFTRNASGGNWNGDPNFSSHDADFSSPNDAYFAWIAQFVDEAAAHGMVVMLTPMYLGYGLGNADGWYHICDEFGKHAGDLLRIRSVSCE